MMFAIITLWLSASTCDAVHYKIAPATVARSSMEALVATDATVTTVRTKHPEGFYDWAFPEDNQKSYGKVDAWEKNYLDDSGSSTEIHNPLLEVTLNNPELVPNDSNEGKTTPGLDAEVKEYNHRYNAFQKNLTVSDNNDLLAFTMTRNSTGEEKEHKADGKALLFTSAVNLAGKELVSHDGTSSNGVADGVTNSHLLTSYWDEGHCGPGEDDQNIHWCMGESHNRSSSPSCLKAVFVSESLCTSGVAQLGSVVGSGWHAGAMSPNCLYGYFAQYFCTNPLRDMIDASTPAASRVS